MISLWLVSLAVLSGCLTLPNTPEPVQFELLRYLSQEDGLSLRPQLGVWERQLHLVWIQAEDDNLEVYYRRSLDEGRTFEVARNLSDTLGVSTTAKIAVSGSQIHVVWQEVTDRGLHVFYRRSANGGQTFEPARVLSEEVLGGAVGPTVAAWGDWVYVAWEVFNPGPNSVYLLRSADNGETFEPLHGLLPHLNRFEDISMTAWRNQLHLVWVDRVSEGAEVYYAKSSDRGDNFQVPINISQNPLDSLFPTLAVQGRTVTVVWENKTTINYDIFQRVSFDGGKTFNQAINLSHNDDDSGAPAVALQGRRMLVAWQNTVGGFREVFLRQSVDTGRHFSSVENLSQSPQHSHLISLAATIDSVHLVWQEDGRESSRIAYRRGLSNPHMP